MNTPKSKTKKPWIIAGSLIAAAALVPAGFGISAVADHSADTTDSSSGEEGVTTVMGAPEIEAGTYVRYRGDDEIGQLMLSPGGEVRYHEFTCTEEAGMTAFNAYSTSAGRVEDGTIQFTELGYFGDWAQPTIELLDNGQIRLSDGDSIDEIFKPRDEAPEYAQECLTQVLQPSLPDAE